MFENMFDKALKIEKGRQWSIPDKKTVNKDAICPINVTISDKPQAYMCQSFF